MSGRIVRAAATVAILPLVAVAYGCVALALGLAWGADPRLT